MAMIKAQLADGFALDIDDAFRDDYELLEAFSSVEDGNVAFMPRAIARTLGAENVKKLKDHLRDEAGNVSSVKMLEAFQELIASTTPGKK